MASTPSASALSAVLRCRGNIWTRNPPTKRPVSSVYSRGAAGGVLRDSSAERTRSKVPAWDAFLQGERVVVGRRLTVACKSPRVEELMFVRRGVLCRSSSGPDDVPQHLLNQQDEENIRHDALQADGQIHSPTDLISAEDTSGSAQSVTEDRPD